MRAPVEGLVRFERTLAQKPARDAFDDAMAIGFPLALALVGYALQLILPRQPVMGVGMLVYFVVTPLVLWRGRVRVRFGPDAFTVWVGGVRTRPVTIAYEDVVAMWRLREVDRYCLRLRDDRLVVLGPPLVDWSFAGVRRGELERVLREVFAHAKGVEVLDVPVFPP